MAIGHHYMSYRRFKRLDVEDRRIVEHVDVLDIDYVFPDMRYGQNRQPNGIGPYGRTNGKYPHGNVFVRRCLDKMAGCERRAPVKAKKHDYPAALFDVFYSLFIERIEYDAPLCVGYTPVPGDACFGCMKKSNGFK